MIYRPRYHVHKVHFRMLQCLFAGCQYHTTEEFQLAMYEESACPGGVRDSSSYQNKDSKLLPKFRALKRRKLTCKDIKNVSFEEEFNKSPTGISQESSFQKGGDGKDNEQDPLGGNKVGHHCHTSNF